MKTLLAITFLVLAFIFSFAAGHVLTTVTTCQWTANTFTEPFDFVTGTEKGKDVFIHTRHEIATECVGENYLPYVEDVVDIVGQFLGDESYVNNN